MDNLNDYTEFKAPEFQIVIIVEFDDGRMFPLTDECPKCMLPIGNRKLLTYQLDMISKSGGTEVVLVAPRDYEAQFTHFLAEYSRKAMKIDLVTIDEMLGSADGLRAVADRIRGDFICFNSDFIGQYTLGDIANLHRQQTSDLTMLFSTLSKDTKRDEVDQEYVGITDTGRVVFKAPTLEMDETVDVAIPLLQRAPTMTMRTNLCDLGVYVMSHWVIEFVKANPRISSIRTDLVPFFVKRQFQPADYLHSKIPALQHRHRPLHNLEAWLVAPDRTQGAVDLLDSVISSLNSQSSRSATPMPPSTPMTTTTAASSASAAASTVCGDDEVNKDLLRCFGLVYDCRALSAAAPAAGAANAASSAHILSRITNIQSYMALNREIPLHSFDSHSPWVRLSGFQKKESSVVGEGTDVANKNITFKQCSIGAHCVIGQNAKLNNCVIMDHVTIGDNCTIQNCVVSEKVVVESGCNLNECHIGHGYKVAQNTKAKNELYSAN